MNAAQAQSILARRGHPAMTVLRRDGVVKMTCHHCTAEAEFTDGDEAERRMRVHWRRVCPVTSPFYPEEGWPDGTPSA